MEAQMLSGCGTHYGWKRQRLTVTATKMAGCGCRMSRHGRLAPVNMVHIWGRLSGGCASVHGKSGNEVPVRPHQVSRWHPGVHQELVHRLPEYGQSSNGAHA